MPDNEAEGNATAQVASSVGIAMQVNATIRVNLAVQHILAAARFSREVGQIESEHRGAQFGPFWEGLFHCSTACVLTAVASLEAYANEVFADRKEVFSQYPTSLMDELWKTYEEKSILEKYEFALLLLSKPPMDRGAAPYQDVKALIDLRNGLTHFKPEWMNEADEHAKISQKLAYKFDGSPFLPSDELLFPRRWASHSCTQWAVRSALAFANSFEQAAELPKKYNVNDLAKLAP